MAGGASVKIGVDVTQFKQGMQQAESSVKTLDAQLKMNEKQLRAVGDAELYTTNKIQLLKKQMEEQRKVVANTQKALEAMRQKGVDQSSESYQKLERSLYNAAGKLMDIQAELNDVSGSEAKASDNAKQLATNLGSISKKVNLDAVISGIGSITTALEKAGKAALKVGGYIWDNIMDSAAWADNTQTAADILGIDVETYQKMANVAATSIDTPVEAIIRSQKKLRSSIGKNNQETIKAFTELGIGVREGGRVMQNNYGSLKMRDSVDLFWEAGEALMKLDDEYEREVKAQAIFGRSWEELRPLFKAGREEYEKALDEQNVVSEENVKTLADLNDQYEQLKIDFNNLKAEVLSGLAPALTKAAEVLSKLMDSVIEYLKTPEGKQALKDMETAVSGLFEDLSNIDPEQVVQSFKSVFDAIVDGLKWLADNKGSVVTALESIVIGWGALKLTGGALKVWELVTGIKGLGGAKGVNNAVNQIANNQGGGSAGGAEAGGLKSMLFKGAKEAVRFATSGPILSLIGATALTAVVSNAVRDDIVNRENEKAEAARAGAAGKANGAQLVGIMDTMHGAIGYKKDANGQYITGFLGTKMLADAADVEAALGTRRGEGLWNEHDLTILKAILSPETYERLGRYYAFVDSTTRGHMDVSEAENRYGVTAADATSISEAVFNEVADALAKDPAPVTVEPKVKENAAEDIAAQIGTVTVSVQAMAGMMGSALLGRFGHANGLFSVPWDGYPAILHKGERVLPAREVGSRTYNSNLYVENMNMSGGADAAGLAGAIAAQQRRTMAGFGS